jgi:hypothetical protein
MEPGGVELSKAIQEQFGQTIIDAFAKFSRADLDDVPTLEATFFDHVSTPVLQRRLAETLYGARWIYKLGLALLVQNEEQMAHVRAQIIDYASVCEGLLRDMIDHALTRGMTGKRYLYADATNQTKPYKHAPLKVNRQPFAWMIVVAADENIVDRHLATALDNLRKERNTVHVHARGYKAFLNKSRWAFDVVCKTSKQSKAWKTANP